jgi:SAM-dependent methyltransferase
MATSCPACGGSEQSVFVATPVDREYFNRRPVPAAILRCRTCASLYQDPWPTQQELQGLYAADYQNYAAGGVPLLRQLTAAYERVFGARFVRRHGNDASVLDFGCGQGGFLQALRRAGCSRLAGFDFVLYDELQSIPGVRFYADLPSIQASGQRFDIIHMRHVIEHLTDPDGTMAQLNRLLTPTGQIIGQTPNAAHYTTRLMGQYWGPLHYPYHTLLFSPEGLARAAARWGLRLSSTAGTILPTGWAMSIENRLKTMIGSRRRGRTGAYTLLMAVFMPMAALDLAIAPRATANFDFVLVRG